MTNTETKDAEGKQHLAGPMVKEATVKDDGRFLFYYSFPEKDSAAAVSADEEDKNV